MTVSFLRSIGLLLILLALVGCRESEQGRNIFYEAGVYKGRNPDVPLASDVRNALRLRAITAAKPTEGGGATRPPSMAWDHLPPVSQRKPLSNRNTAFKPHLWKYWRHAWPYLRCDDQRARSGRDLLNLSERLRESKTELTQAKRKNLPAAEIDSLQKRAQEHTAQYEEGLHRSELPCPDHSGGRESKDLDTRLRQRIERQSTLK